MKVRFYLLLILPMAFVFTMPLIGAQAPAGFILADDGLVRFDNPLGNSLRQIFDRREWERLKKWRGSDGCANAR